MRTLRTAMIAKNSMGASDLFVMLERAFRQRTRNCKTCSFSLPYRVGHGSSWAVIAAHTCSDSCRMLLDEVVAEHQQRYALAD